jgi:hypothetical protein
VADPPPAARILPAKMNPHTGEVTMPQPGLLHDVVLGQLVQLRADPIEKRGNIVAVLMTQPCQALVRWPAGESTFELLDDLIATT